MFAVPCEGRIRFGFLQSLPDILAARNLKDSGRLRYVDARQNNKPIIWGMADTSLKRDWPRFLIDLMEKGFISGYA